jgi:hypothetical protein
LSVTRSNVLVSILKSDAATRARPDAMRPISPRGNGVWQGLRSFGAEYGLGFRHFNYQYNITE